MWISEVQLELPTEIVVALVVAAIALAIAVIWLLVDAVKHLSGFAEALDSHAKVNRVLNEDVARYAEEKRELRGLLETIENRLAAVKDELIAEQKRVTQLEIEKAATAEKVGQLQEKLERRDAQHHEISEALTAQIGALKADLQRERAERQQLESEMRKEIARLTKENDDLSAENEHLKQSLAETRTERNALSDEVKALRGEVDEIRKKGDTQP